MLKIEIRTKTFRDEDDPTEVRKRHYIIVNGITDEDSYFSTYEFPTVHVTSTDVIEILTKHSFNKIGSHFNYFNFNMSVDWWESELHLYIYCEESYDDIIPRIQFNLQLQDWEHWAKPWSMSSLAKQFELNISKLGNAKIEYWQDDPDSILNGFGIVYYPSQKDLIIKNEIDYVLDILKPIVDETKKNLLDSIDSEAVLTYFQFPDEIKTACKQYLVYFTQFIADMGIAVDTELKEELNHTLFKIIPKDKDESLDRVREALSIYLNAPSHQDFQVQVSNQTNIAVKQWEANIYHLKSQLSLASSIIQAKDSTIEMLQLSNYQYKQMLESHNSKKDSEKEEIIKGIVAVKKYEGKGFSIDFAEIFRRLKRIVK